MITKIWSNLRDRSDPKPSETDRLSELSSLYNYLKHLQDNWSTASGNCLHRRNSNKTSYNFCCIPVYFLFVLVQIFYIFMVKKQVGKQNTKSGGFCSTDHQWRHGSQDTCSRYLATAEPSVLTSTCFDIHFKQILNPKEYFFFLKGGC